MSGFRLRRAVRARRLAVVGGLILAAGFFMPAVQGCNAPIVPAKEAADMLTVQYDELDEILPGYPMFVASYLLGLLAGLRAAWRLWKPHGEGEVAGVLIGGNMLLTGTMLIGAVAVNAAGSDSFDGWAAMGLAVGGLLVAYYVAALRLTELRGLHHQFLSLVVACGWFSLFVGGALYGLYVSWAATLVLLIATVIEVAAVSGRTAWQTAAGLALCRLTSIPDDGVRCPGCDYLLIGLTRQRCPECGRAFTFEEFGVGPDEMGFAARR